MMGARDVRRHGALASKIASEQALLQVVEGVPSTADGGYVAQGSFNRRTGKFEGAGQVCAFAVT
jgi:hypothetical protein